MPPFFVFDERLGIPVPRLLKDWDQHSLEEQQEILKEWEQIRGAIPDRIIAFERVVNEKQERMGREDSFEECCRLNSEIAELASRINDLNILFRTG